MRLTCALIAGFAIVLPAWAVYAPIPEQDQGKDFTFSVRAGWSYDSNIFGGATDVIGSPVWQVAPRVAFNKSLTDQTFFSASYGLTLDDVERRPGTKLLDSHDLMLRTAHAFSKLTVLDVYDSLLISRNPESLLNGVPVNSDQSVTRNQLDGRFTTSLTPKIGAEVKARSVYYGYRNGNLGRLLNRMENLYGLAGNYAILPEFKAVSEYRHQDVFYRNDSAAKDKSSDYLMTGVDYDVARKLTLGTRLGAEWRRRRENGDATVPYAEVSGRYQYAEKSFLAGGYAYTFDETSDPNRFTDQRVNRYFVNLQHAVTALIVASVSLDYEPAVLQAREHPNVPAGTIVKNLNETATRVGTALSYLPAKNWTISITYDLDHTKSDDPSRSVERHRVGVSGSYTF